MSDARIKCLLAEELEIGAAACPEMYQSAVRFEQIMKEQEKAEKKARKQAAKQKEREQAKTLLELKRKKAEEKKLLIEKQKQELAMQKEREKEDLLKSQVKLAELKKKLKVRSTHKNNNDNNNNASNDTVDKLTSLQIQKKILELELSDKNRQLKRAKTESEVVSKKLTETQSSLSSSTSGLDKLKVKFHITQNKLAELASKGKATENIINECKDISNQLDNALSTLDSKLKLSSVVKDFLTAYSSCINKHSETINKNQYHLKELYNGILQFQAFSLKMRGNAGEFGECDENKEYMIKVILFMIACKPDMDLDYKDVLTQLDSLVVRGKELKGTAVSVANYLDLIGQDVRNKVGNTISMRY